MKGLSLTLFLLGIPWALLCVSVLFGPIMVFTSETFMENSLEKKVLWFSLTSFVSLLTAVGYWVWIGWIRYFISGSYPRNSPNRFWGISLVSHLLWVIVIPLMVASDDHSLSFDVVSSWQYGFSKFLIWGGVAYGLIIWLVLNIVISGYQLGSRRFNQPID